MKSRKKITNLFNLQGPLLLALFSFFTLVGCESCDIPIPKEKKSKSVSKPESKPAGKRGTIGSKRVIVLLHGLNDNEAKATDDLGKKLKGNLPNSEVIILNRHNSGTASISQQVGEMNDELKKQLEQKGLNDCPICLIGDSQGGLIAVEFYHRYKDELNIKGIITNHSPLEGAPGVTADAAKLNNLKAAIKNIVHEATFGLGDSLVDQINVKDLFTQNITEAVKQDLTKDSPLLREVASTLSTINIPVLVLSGEIDTFEGIKAAIKVLVPGLAAFNIGGLSPLQILDNIPVESKKKLTDSYEAIVGDSKHDGIVPLYSQIGEHIQMSSTVMRITGKGYHHFYGMAEVPDVYSKIFDFINNKVFAFTK